VFYKSNHSQRNLHFKKSLKIPKGNQNPQIDEEQTTQWLKEKGQKDQQRSTKHTYKTKYRVTRTPLKLVCSFML
jgi:topoisomerase IA-like protein